MADEPKQEEKAEPGKEEAHAEKKEEKKPVGTLESVINETSSLLKTIGGVSGAEKRDKTPYLVAAANLGYKAARNTTKGFYDAIYGIGKSLAEKLYSPSKPAAPAQPAAAPAH